MTYNVFCGTLNLTLLYSDRYLVTLWQGDVGLPGLMGLPGEKGEEGLTGKRGRRVSFASLYFIV